MYNDIKIKLREGLMSEFSIYADIKPFKMIFDEQLRDSLKFKHVLKILNKHGHDIGRYNGDDNGIVNNAPIVLTVNELEFYSSELDNVPILTYEDFIKKYN
jgi:hypothetical protein